MTKADKPICPLPFAQVVLYPDGIVRQCCLLPGKHMIGDIRKEPLNRIINGKKARELRREFMSGKIKTCAANMQNLKCHLWWPQFEDKIQVSEIQKGPLLKLDIRLNGQCNLECVMCSVWEAPNGVYDKVGFWEKAEKDIFPHLLEMEVLGGEPFIQKDTYRLIDTVSRLNPECKWAFTTNGHWKFTPFIRQSLDRIAIRQITVSIDSLIPEVYSKIRLKGDLKVPLRTLEDLCAYRDSRAKNRPFELRVTMVVQIDNFHEIKNFLEFGKQRGITADLALLSLPGKFSLLGLNKKDREDILSSLEELYQSTSAWTLLGIINPIRDSLDPEKRFDQVLGQFYGG